MGLDYFFIFKVYSFLILKGNIMTDEKKTCFVIMPFGEKPDYSKNSFDNIYDKILHPAISGLKYRCKKATNTANSPDLLKNILIELRNKGNIIVADLTGNNPNVFYELGLRHALLPGKTILIAQKDAEIATDLRNWQRIEYIPETENNEILKCTIENLQKEIFFRIHQPTEAKPDSPIFDLFPDYLNITIRLDEQSIRINELEKDYHNLENELITKEEEITKNWIPKSEHIHCLHFSKQLSEKYKSARKDLDELRARIESKLEILPDIESEIFDLKMALLERLRKE